MRSSLAWAGAAIFSVATAGCTGNGVGDSCVMTKDCIGGLVCDDPTGKGGVCRKPGDVPVRLDAAADATPPVDAPADGARDAPPGDARDGGLAGDAASDRAPGDALSDGAGDALLDASGDVPVLEGGAADAPVDAVSGDASPDATDGPGEGPTGAAPG